MGMLIKSFSIQSTARQVRPMEAQTGIPTRNRTMRRPMKKTKVNILVFLNPQNARMKLHEIKTANRRISNIEPQNDEGWFRCAQSFYRTEKQRP